jgi:hypothetical protein
LRGRLDSRERYQQRDGKDGSAHLNHALTMRRK